MGRGCLAIVNSLAHPSVARRHRKATRRELIAIGRISQTASSCTVRGMWMRNLVWAAVVVGLVAGCGGDEEDSNSGGTGGGGAGGAGGAAGTAGTSGGVGGGGGAGGTAGTVSGGAGGMGGAGGGFMIPECSPEPGPSMCGTNACPTTTAGVVCLKNCCTADMQCGLSSTALTTCTIPNPGMCPAAMVFGQAATPCCVAGTNTCGVLNTLLGDPPCVAREDVPAAGLQPANCDGTPVAMPDGGGGMGGAGGGDPADAGM